MSQNPLLSLNKVSKSYGSLCVVNEVSFEINEGETVGIIGPNGAGKTTLFNLIAGTLALDKGAILFNGSEITHLRSDQCCQKGLGRTFQIPRTFEDMSVYENVLVGLVSQNTKLKKQEIQSKAIAILEMTNLIELANTKACYLSIIKKKSLSLACALSTSPKLLLLDEVAGGLTDYELQNFTKILDAIKESGVTIVWIEHAIYALASYVDRMIVINFGEQIADGKPKTLMNDPLIKEIYLGVESS